MSAGIMHESAGKIKLMLAACIEMYNVEDQEGDVWTAQPIIDCGKGARCCS